MGRSDPSILDKVDAKSLDDYREAFSLFDKNENGEISVTELGLIMRGLGQNPTERELKDMIDEVDVDRSGVVEFPEFVALMEKNKKMLTPEEQQGNLVNAFQLFDRDGNGLIDAHELTHVMKNLGEKLTEEEALAMIKEADVDHDGMINYEEFVKMMVTNP